MKNGIIPLSDHEGVRVRPWVAEGAQAMEGRVDGEGGMAYE